MLCLTVRSATIILTILLMPFAAHAAQDTERRIALVIGVGAYQHAPHLANPINDAQGIGDTLRRLHFDVTELYDPGFQQLNQGIREFGIRAAGADVAVVYYAGHGVQVDRENYLIPADAKLERERDLLYEAMPLDRLMGEVSQATHVGIVLLDSCRNNPFVERASRSMTVAGRAVSTLQGLARVDNVPRNTMVVMAAKADQIAEDGTDHSPFAAALLAHLQIPGLELSLFFRSVRDTVLRSTHNRQEPWVYSSLGADPFYFYPRPPNRPPEIGAIKPLEIAEIAGPTPLGMPQPVDPDQDPLTVRIIGLPRSGEIRIDGKPAALNTIVTVDQFKTALYKPDGKTIGSAGTLDVLVEDGRGGSITASLPIRVQSSHHPPVLGSPGKIQVSQQLLNIPRPVSPDGDALTVAVTALPRGTIRNGGAIIHPGDHITPDELAGLTFWPEAGFTGPAGSLRYTVDNGHGGIVEGSTDVEVTVAAAPADATAEASVWASLQGNTDPAEFTAFLRLFPNSPHADEARRRERDLTREPRVATVPPPKQPIEAAARQPAEIVAKQQPEKVIPAAVETAKPPPPPVPASAGSTPPGSMPPGPAALAMVVPLVPVPPTPPRGQVADQNRFQDCPQCPRMVRIPAGGFMMGQGAREPESQPPHHVDVHTFAIGQSPVTVAEWKACMSAKGCNFLPRMRVADDRTPVHNLSWEDIGQYMAWLTATTGHPYRLPSEAEWEYAARGGTSTRYWWGDSVGMALANCADCGGAQDAYGPLPADGWPPNPFGLFDILGGVAQWTADCWFPNYRGAPSDATPRDAKLCEKRVLRGGSFRSKRDEITVTYRSNYDAPVRYLVNGFRVARDTE
jgi:formylglycine-generating enzyme required for sulfatase activity